MNDQKVHETELFLEVLEGTKIMKILMVLKVLTYHRKTLRRRNCRMDDELTKIGRAHV